MRVWGARERWFESTHPDFSTIKLVFITETKEKVLEEPINVKIVEEIKNEKITLENSKIYEFGKTSLNENYQLIVKFKSQTYRGTIKSKNLLEVRLKEIDKLNDKDWIPMSEDFEYTFPKNSINRYKKN